MVIYMYDKEGAVSSVRIVTNNAHILDAAIELRYIYL